MVLVCVGYGELFGCRSLPRQGYFFCLETKEAKIQDSRNASLPHEACPAKRVKPRPGNSTLCFAAHSPRFGRKSLCPAAAPAGIVLPVFGRSLSAVGGCGFMNWNVVARDEVSFMRYSVRHTRYACASRGDMSNGHKLMTNLIN